MSHEADNNALSFATLDELVEELARRSETLIVALVLKSDTATASRCRLIGNRLLGQGLYMDLADLIQRRLRDAPNVGDDSYRAEDADEDDEEENEH